MGVAEEVPLNGNRFALQFVGPSSIVAKALYGQGNIGRGAVLALMAERLAIVQRFQRLEEVPVPFDQGRQLEDQIAAVGPIHRAPRRANRKGGVGGCNLRKKKGQERSGFVSCHATENTRDRNTGCIIPP